MAWSALLILICVGVSFGEHINVLQHDFDIKMEFAKLNQRVIILEKDNADKAGQIFQLEKAKTNQATAIVKLQLKNEGQRNDILHLERVLKSSGKQTSALQAEQTQTCRIIDELKLKVEKCGKTVEVDQTKEANETEKNLVFRKPGHVRQEQSEMENVSVTSAVKNEHARIQKRSSEKTRELADVIQQVAFTAFVTPTEYGPLGQGQIVKFDNVVTNIGNAYHSNSGTFIAPVDGVYMFFATVAGDQHPHSTGRNFVQVQHNGNELTGMLVSHFDQSSQMLILSLRTHDEINLTNEVANDVLLGTSLTSFSGILLNSS